MAKQLKPLPDEFFENLAEDFTPVDIEHEITTHRPKKITKRRARRMSILQLCEAIVEGMEDSGLRADFIAYNQALCCELGTRLSFSPEQAMWLALLVNMADDNHIQARDLARFLGCKPIRVLAQWHVIDSLVSAQYVGYSQRITNKEGVYVPDDVMIALRDNHPYEAPAMVNLSIDQWIDRLCTIMDRRDDGTVRYRDFTAYLTTLKQGNTHLQLVNRLGEYNLNETDEVVLLLTAGKFLTNNDEQIGYDDISDICETKWEARNIARHIANGEHPLITMGLIEYANNDGQANPAIWHLTAKAKDELLAETNISVKVNPVFGLTLSTDLTPKTLYYPTEVSRSVDRLSNLLTQDRFAVVQNRLQQRGMRRGFACLFYGSPGTGKTETVYQLARTTGRHIMMVDVPNLRSKWVGDTEKNIKAVFDRYRRLVSQSTLAPILLFNEADAVLCRRSDNATSSVDKMENAMQNIILQEMENLNGIMIATTNLTSNLDQAFERRFLYKIEFPKPTATERVHIWQSMLPELSADQAQQLAAKYAFSGGQIENITRKHIVDCILSGDDGLNMTALTEACSTESIKSTTRQAIGFG